MCIFFSTQKISHTLDLLNLFDAQVPILILKQFISFNIVGTYLISYFNNIFFCFSIHL